MFVCFSCFLIMKTLFIYTECFCMIFFCINMSLITCTYVCLMLISCSLLFSFLFFFFVCLPLIWLFSSLHYALHLSAYFLFYFSFYFCHPALVFQCSHPNYDTMMHRQSEDYREHILWHQFLVTGASKGRYQSFHLPRSCKIVQQWYLYLLNPPGQHVFVCHFLHCRFCL